MNEYSYPSKVSIFLGTWNVNGKMLKRERLDDWLTSPKGRQKAPFVTGVHIDVFSFSWKTAFVCCRHSGAY